MYISYTAPTPLEYFATLVESDNEFALFEAAICLAQDEYPAMDVQGVMDDVDQLLVRVRGRLPADAAQMQKLRVLNHFFFKDLHFAGNVNDYYHPDNSFIHAVLSSRRGIPVTLALLWMELAQGLGLNAVGVGFPGHFMVKVGLPMGQAVIDPLSGKSLGREELLRRLEPFLPDTTDASEDEAAPLGLYLQEALPRDIIARMLRNLKEIYRTQQDWVRVLAVQERLIVLLPSAWDEYRDRGLAHAELGNIELALADLECYMLHARNLVDMDAIAQRADGLRRHTG